MKRLGPVGLKENKSPSKLREKQRRFIGKMKCQVSKKHTNSKYEMNNTLLMKDMFLYEKLQCINGQSNIYDKITFLSCEHLMLR